MRSRERTVPEATEAGEGLIEFINHRRAEQARQRRQHVLVAIIATLGLITVLLTVSNVILIRRLASGTTAPPSAPVRPSTARTEPPRAPDTATPPESNVADTSASPADTPTSAPVVETPPPAPRRTPPPRRSDVTPSVSSPASPSPSPDSSASSRRLSSSANAPTLPVLPERTLRPAPPAPLPEPKVRESVSAEAPMDSAERTADWLVQTYGRVEAESRALRVAEFYSGERRAFWRRVLDDVRRTPEP